jgi:hypothetical protein
MTASWISAAERLGRVVAELLQDDGAELLRRVVAAEELEREVGFAHRALDEPHDVRRIDHGHLDGLVAHDAGVALVEVDHRRRRRKPLGIGHDRRLAELIDDRHRGERRAEVDAEQVGSHGFSCSSSSIPGGD